MNRNRTLLFISNAIAMILELVAARILAPYFGTSNTVWTVIITMMLVANAVGNYFGGVYADKYSPAKLNIIALFLTAISTCGIMIFNSSVLQNIKGDMTGEQPVSYTTYVSLVIILFMLPCICIGAISPITNKCELKNVDSMGKHSGKIYSVITVGSIVGTLIGGLFLIPKFGCNAILLLISWLLFFYIVALLVMERSQILSSVNFQRIAVLMLVSLLAINLYGVHIQLEKTDDIIVIDTGDNYVRIFNDKYNGEDVRVMNVTGGFSSSNFTDPAKRDELVYSYTQAYNTVFEADKEFTNLMMIGGAGYSYPRYIISHYQDKTMDVVEIDGGITDIAKKYFYLQDFLDEYGSDRLNLITADGRVYLNETDKKYDVIFNDAFMGDSPARSIATRETVELIHDSLNDGGVYTANFIGNINGSNYNFIRSEIKTISSVFDHVWVQISNANDEGYGNYIVFASDADYGYDTISYTLTDNDIIFTDDYAPVEFFTSGLIK